MKKNLIRMTLLASVLSVNGAQAAQQCVFVGYSSSPIVIEIDDCPVVGNDPSGQCASGQVVLSCDGGNSDVDCLASGFHVYQDDLGIADGKLTGLKPASSTSIVCRAKPSRLNIKELKLVFSKE